MQCGRIDPEGMLGTGQSLAPNGQFGKSGYGALVIHSIRGS